jgi:hypothetical protein
MTGDNRQRKISRLLIYSLVPIVLTLLLIKRIGSYDIWYHMVIGRKIFENFSIPKTEFFLYPILGEETSFHEWGFGFLFYTAHRWFGFWGMSILHALIGGGTLYLFYRAAEVDRRNNPLAIMFLSVILILVYYRLIYRPEIVLFLCLGFEIYLLEKFALDMRWKVLLPIPVLSFFLSNFHPSVFFLLLVFGFYIIQFSWVAYRNHIPQSRILGISVSFLFASILTSLINPYGIQQVILPFSYMQSGELLKSVNEYLPTLTTTLKWPFIAICSVSFLVLVFQKNRRPVDWLLFVFFGYLGLKYVRNVALFGLVMYIPVVRGFDQLTAGVPFFASNIGKKILWSSACLAVGIAATVILQQGKWGAGPNLQRFPDEAVRVIKEVEPPGRIMNYYDTGGYLAWKLYDEYRVFIDGRRYDMDKITKLHNRIFFKGDPQWEQILARYHVSTIVTRATARFTGQLIPLVAYLYIDDDWVLSAVEPWYYLFVRREAIKDWGDVPVLDKKIIWQMVIKETEAIASMFGYSAQTHLSRGIAYFKLGNWKAAKESFEKYLQKNPSDEEVKQIIAWFEAAERGDMTAKKNLEMFY